VHSGPNQRPVEIQLAPCSFSSFDLENLWPRSMVCLEVNLLRLSALKDHPSRLQKEHICDSELKWRTFVTLL